MVLNYLRTPKPITTYKLIAYTKPISLPHNNINSIWLEANVTCLFSGFLRHHIKMPSFSQQY